MTIEPLIWNIVGTPVYLMGTIHFAPHEGYQLGPKCARAFDESGRVVEEADLRNLQLDQNVFKRKSGSLKQDLGDERYSRFVESGFYAPAFEELNLGIIFSALGSRPYSEMNLVHGGVDRMLAECAESSGKVLEFLETASLQIELMMGLSAAEACIALDMELNSPGYFSDVARRVWGGYHGAAEYDLGLLREETISRTPNLANSLFTFRENQWMPRILRAIEKREKVIFAVGVLHLVGRDSCVGRLGAAGYECRLV